MVSNDAINWREALLFEGASIEQAIHCLNDAALQIVMVVNMEGQLVGTITDGDIRRALLRGVTISDSVDEIVARNALVVPPDMQHELVIQLMRANRIHQLPMLDEQRRVVGLHIWSEVISSVERPNLMVIMAGGLGTRLAPHTETCPKPLLSVAGKPMLEHIIERAKSEGFSNFVIAVRYLGHMIEEYFGRGSHLGVHIEYLREEDPLGTAGALGLISPFPESPVIVTNGDVLTDIRYGELLDFHIRNGAEATMAVRQHELQHPFGVVRIKGIDIVSFDEKPVYRTHVNAGVYALSAGVFKHLKVGERLDMPSLFTLLKGRGARTVVYPMHEPWLDVGSTETYTEINERGMDAFGL